jgi:hypothetical protein
MGQDDGMKEDAKQRGETKRTSETRRNIEDVIEEAKNKEDVIASYQPLSYYCLRPSPRGTSV